MIALTHALGRLKETSSDSINNASFLHTPISRHFLVNTVFTKMGKEKGWVAGLLGGKGQFVCVGFFFIIFILGTCTSKWESCMESHTVVPLTLQYHQWIKFNLPVVVKHTRQFWVSALISYFPTYFWFSKYHFNNSAKQMKRKKESKQIRMQQ